MFTWLFVQLKRNRLTREHGLLFKYPLRLGFTLININYSNTLALGELTEKPERHHAPQITIPG